MNNNEVKQAEMILAQYQEKEESKLDKLKALDKKVKRPADVFAYAFGTVGALVLGTGMSLAMGVIGNGLTAVGVVVGCVGILAVSTNHLIRNKILKARKEKYAQRIVELSDEILNA